MTIEAKLDRTNSLLEALINLIAKTSGASDETLNQDTATEAPPPAKPKRGRPSKSVTKKDDTKKQTKDEDADLFGDADDNTPPAKPLATREDVKATLKALRDTCGAAALSEILTAYDASALSQLAPERYDAIVEQAKEQIEAAKQGGSDDDI